MQQFMSRQQRIAFYNPCFLACEALDERFHWVEAQGISITLTIECGWGPLDWGFARPDWHVSVASPIASKFKHSKLQGRALSVLKGVGMTDKACQFIDKTKDHKLRFVHVRRLVTEAEAEKLPALKDLRDTEEAEAIFERIASLRGIPLSTLKQWELNADIGAMEKGVLNKG